MYPFLLLYFILNLKIFSGFTYYIPFFLNSCLNSCDENKEYPNLDPDTNIKPCEDFYLHACNNWISKTIKPNSELIWNRWQEASSKTKRNLIKILNEKDFTTNPLLTKTKKLYKSCIQRDELNETHLKELKILIESLGGWPLITENWHKDFKWPLRLIKITRLFSVNPIFKIHVAKDLHNSTARSIYLSEGDFSLPIQILKDPKKHPREIKVYANWIYEVAKTLQGGKYGKINRRKIKEMIDFESKLAKLIVGREQVIRMNIKNVSEKFKINFMAMLSRLFVNSEVKINSKDVVILTCENYLREVIILLDDTKTEVIINYIIWSLIRDLSRDVSENLRMLNFIVNKAILGLRDDFEVAEECIGKVTEYMGYTLIPAYVETFIERSVLDEVEKITNAIKEKFINLLERNEWLSDESRRGSVEKIKFLKYYLGYPAWGIDYDILDKYYGDVQIAESYFLNILKLRKRKMKLELNSLREGNFEWPINPFEANALYSILENAIYIPLAMMQEPFFLLNRPRSLNFGSLGSIIGHEISHALDNKGRHGDKKGNIVSWWKDEDVFIYNKHIECFEVQYGNLGVDGQESISENIADNIGTDISYRALVNSNEEFSVELLSELEFSEAQLFFFGFAQTWCELPEGNEFLEVDIYSPSHVRVLGTLQNNKNFKEVFKCEDESKKCELW